MQNYSENCPREFNCSGHHDGRIASFSIGTVPSYISLVSSTLSCFGSALILLAFVMLPDIRTGAQKLITLLSIADFFTAFGYFVAGINFLKHYQPLGQSHATCSAFHTVCEIQSFITTTSSLCSFLWTTILAAYFHFVIVNKQTLFHKKTFILTNFIAWGVPFLITVPLLATRRLGYSHLATSNWCYIKDSSTQPHLLGNSEVLKISLPLVAGKLWEVLSYIVVTILYISISCSIYKTRRKLALIQNNNSSPRTRSNVELRLLSIPVVFLMLRVWGTAQFFYSLANKNIQHCISPQMHRVFFWLGIMQAVGDSGQGWSNALLYIFLSPSIRKWLIFQCITSCCTKLQKLSHYCYGSIEYTPFSRQTIVNNNDEQDALVRSMNEHVSSHERTALNRTDTGSLSDSYGTIITKTLTQSARESNDTQETTKDRASTEKRNKELLDTASLSIRLVRNINDTT